MVRGSVYDVSQRVPLSAVSVISKAGFHTETDTLGQYKIVVRDTDSIYFSYLGKRTPWFPVSTIKNLLNFEVALNVTAPDLAQLFIRKRSYREDSIQNRRDYEKIFNFHKPGFATSMNSPESGNMGVGLDLDAFINMFRFGYNKRQKGYREFFEWQEQEKYVDYHFSKNIVKKVTGYPDEKLDLFMKHYRPSYEFLLGLNDIELGTYITRCKENYETAHPASAKEMMEQFWTNGIIKP